MSFCSPAIFAATLLLTGATAWIAGSTLHLDLYMDEIFHIPQAQLYCEGRFGEWNDKITTFPGLYILSSLVHGAFKYLWPLESIACSALFLRILNIVLAAFVPIGAALCRGQICRGKHSDAWEISLVLAVYPFTMFYYFMFYTDTLSTSSILIAYYASFAGEGQLSTARSFTHHALVFLAASCTILVRQTNAVWVLFMAGTLMLHKLEAADVFKDNFDGIFSQLAKFVVAIVTHLAPLLAETWSLLLPVVAFLTFVLQNGSIVVGDKEHHEAVVHLAMPLHMLACLALVTGPIDLGLGLQKIVNEFCLGGMKTLAWRILIAALLVGGVGYCLLYGCMDHEFLLADNRHYTFYIWRHILSNFKMRAALVVPYTLCLVVAMRKLFEVRGPMWVLIFAIAAVVTLVPARLFEFRYFTPGVFIAYLNFPQITGYEKIRQPVPRKIETRKWWQFSWFITFINNLMISMVLLYIFIRRPFVWGDGSVARISRYIYTIYVKPSDESEDKLPPVRGKYI